MWRLIYVLLICAVVLTWETVRVSFGDATSPSAATAATPTAPAHAVQLGSPSWPVPPTPLPGSTTPPATLTILKLHVNAPVYERGIDDQGLPTIAPGYAVTHFDGSAAAGALGNYVVYGHDDIQGEVFRSLALLRPGDSVIVSQGTHHYSYQVRGSRVVDPTAVDVLRSTGESIMTLISCTPYGVDTQRIVVTAALTRVS